MIERSTRQCGNEFSHLDLFISEEAIDLVVREIEASDYSSITQDRSAKNRPQIRQNQTVPEVGVGDYPRDHWSFRSHRT